MGLRLEGPACLEVLVDTTHRRDAVAETGSDLGSDLALVVELKGRLANTNRNGFHNRSLHPHLKTRYVIYENALMVFGKVSHGGGRDIRASNSRKLACAAAQLKRCFNPLQSRPAK